MPGSSALAEIHVVLVEPSTMQAHLVSRMLANQGVGSTEVCQTGAEALLALQKVDRGWVVISSLYLPDQAGTDLVAAMRA